MLQAEAAKAISLTMLSHSDIIYEKQKIQNTMKVGLCEVYHPIINYCLFQEFSLISG